MTERKRGDKKLFGTYWSSSGPIRIELQDYVWDGEQWVMPGSPKAEQIEAELQAACKQHGYVVRDGQWECEQCGFRWVK